MSRKECYLLKRSLFIFCIFLFLLGAPILVFSEEKSSDELYTQAQSEPTASGKLDLYSEGYETYPDDDRFKEGLQTSVQALLD
mgnify:CR=1 FL=1